MEIEELPWIAGNSTLPTPITTSSFTGNVLLWEAQGKALGGLLKLVYCASLGDKYVAVVQHLAYLIRHSSEDWSMADGREALSTLGEEFTQRLSDSVENIKLEIQAAKNIEGSGAAPTVVQLLGVATTAGLDGSSFFISAHVVYDLGPGSFFETEVVDDLVQRHRRRTERLARDADNALRDSMRGRLRGSGTNGGNPGADDDDNPPRGGDGSGGSMNATDVEALVARTLKSERELTQRNADHKARREREEKRGAGKKKTRKYDDSVDGNEAEPDTGTVSMSLRAAGQFAYQHKRISLPSRLRGGGGGPGTQYPSLISKDELAEAREYIPTMPDGKQLCIKRATHDDCDREPFYLSHAELPTMMSSPEAIKCLPCVVQMMSVAYGGFKKSSLTPIPRNAREAAVKLLRASTGGTRSSGWVPAVTGDVARSSG